MIKSTFGLTETGAIRSDNQDSYLIDINQGVFAVADGLGGLPNGERASKVTLELLQNKLHRANAQPIAEIIGEVNVESRNIGFQMDVTGFGTTLTMGRLVDDGRAIEIAHVGDSAACIVADGEVKMVTREHTVAARMAEDTWQDASEAIPLAAHHTLTQCIGQDLYIDPQVLKLPILPGTRLFFMTDGVTKPMTEDILEELLLDNRSLEAIAQALSFRIEAAGAPDNYTIVAVEFT